MGTWKRSYDLFHVIKHATLLHRKWQATPPPLRQQGPRSRGRPGSWSRRAPHDEQREGRRQGPGKVGLDRVRRARVELRRAPAACNIERTSRYLAGELPGVAAAVDQGEDETMGTKMFRVPEDLWDRVEWLLTSIENAPELAAAGARGPARC